MGTFQFDSLVGFEIKKMLLNKITATMLVLIMLFMAGTYRHYVRPVTRRL